MRKGKIIVFGAIVYLGCMMPGFSLAQDNVLTTPVNQTPSPENLTAVTVSLPPAAQNPQAPSEPEGYAGEFFGTPVPLANYYFVKYALAVFGNREGPPPKTPVEVEGLVWDGLLLSYEAFRRNIEVGQEEIDSEIDKILETEKAAFDRKKDREAYEKWVKDKTNEPAVAFENQIRHLLQIQKLKEKVKEGIIPQVQEYEAKQKFLDEYNTLSVELRQFDSIKDAREFYKKARANPLFWEEQKKLYVKDFSRPGFVSLEFLMDLWKFPKEGLYKMMKEPIGRIHPPEPIYKGFGVFRILEKRVANEKEFVKARDSYYNKVRRRKQYDGVSEWFKNLKEEAAIKVYPRPKETSIQTAQGSAVQNTTQAGK